MVERERYAFIKREIARINALPPPEPLSALLAMRQDILDQIPSLNLPPNPLDDLIDRLGGADQVAEMTGRSGRMLRAVGTDGRRKNFFVYNKRISSNSSASQDDSDRLNLVERGLFMDARKSVALISDAASTGISLHASYQSASKNKRRVHYTLELPWSADKAVQQLG